MRRKNYKFKFETIEQVMDAAAQYVISARPHYQFAGTANSANVAVQLLRYCFAGKQNEEMWALFLDNQNQVIAREQLAGGTINAATIHPRVAVQLAIKHNAAAMIVSHNHPSGHLQPSQADLEITKRLISAMELIDVKVHDHIIFGHNDFYSMADYGQI